MAAPGPKAPTETFEVTLAKDRALYGEFFAAETPRAKALILHGYADHGGRYREVANVLNQMGVTCSTIDLRGHGRSTGQRGFVRSFDDYVEDVLVGAQELDKRISADVPLLVFGHSNGALITLKILADPDPVLSPAIAILASPFLGFKVEVSLAKRMLGHISGHLVPKLALSNQLTPDMLTSDPERQKQRETDTLCHDVATAKWFLEVQKVQQYVLHRAADIRVPTIWLVSGADTIADPAAARAVRNKLTADHDYREYEDFRHEGFNEQQRGQWFADLSTLLDARLREIG